MKVLPDLQDKYITAEATHHELGVPDPHLGILGDIMDGIAEHEMKYHTSPTILIVSPETYTQIAAGATKYTDKIVMPYTKPKKLEIYGLECRETPLVTAGVLVLL
jgi:hypothetical protein